MGRVSDATIGNINKFFDWWFTEHPETEGKCTLCNETLTHIVKQAEVKAEAATATVTKELAKRINDNAAPQDRVSGEQLRQRTLRKSGERSDTCANRTNSEDDQLELPLGITKEDVEQHIVTPANRQEQSMATSVIYPHLFNPIEGISTCPLSPEKVYRLIPDFSKRKLEKLDSAIDFLIAIKRIHGGNDEIA